MLSGLESPLHLLVLLVIVGLLFGPKRLPELGRSLGGGIRSFRQTLEGEQQDPPEAANPPAATQVDHAQAHASTENASRT